MINSMSFLLKEKNSLKRMLKPRTLEDVNLSRISRILCLNRFPYKYPEEKLMDILQKHMDRKML